MARRRDVANAGTYEMGRPANQYGGSARNRQVENAGTGALRRLAIGNGAVADPLGRNGSTAGFGRGTQKPTYNYGDELGILPVTTPAPRTRTNTGIDGYASAELGAIGIDSATMKPFTNIAGPKPAAAGGSGGSGGGGAGKGGAVASVPAAVAAPAATEPRVNPLTALYEKLFASIGSQRGARDAFWEGQNADLSGRYDTAQQNQRAAMANAMQIIGNGSNPYAGLQPSASQTAGNPLAAYMEATGVDPAQVNALVQLNAANNQQYDSAVRDSLAQLGAAYEQANQSRLNDMGVMNAGFQSDLDAQRNALAASMATQQAGENATFDQRLFEAGQAQIADNQAFATNDQNRQMTLFQNILSSYGDSLDPQSLVELVTAFAQASGMPPAALMPTGGV